MPISKGKFEDEVKRIENLRNPLAHGSSYEMKWEDVVNLRKTVKTLVELRQPIKMAVLTRPVWAMLTSASIHPRRTESHSQMGMEGGDGS